MKFSLIIPAKNEEKRILLPLIQYYYALLREVGPKKFEIIVVINNTTDRTAESIRSLKKLAGFKEVKVVTLNACNGKGEAVIHGFRLAKGKIVGFIDADGSSAHTELVKMYETLIVSNADAVIASRYAKGGHIVGGRSLDRVVASKALHQIITHLFKTPFHDFFCGLKLFKREVLNDLFTGTFTYGWTFDVNMLVHLFYNGYRVIEVPTIWSDRTNSKVNILKSGPKVIKDLAKIFARYNGKPKTAPVTEPL